MRGWRSLIPVGVGLPALAVIGLIAVNLGIEWTGRKTVLDQTTQLLQGKQGDDSWRVMTTAIQIADSATGREIYQRLSYEDHQKFQYPPTSLLGLWVLYRVAHLETSTVWVLLKLSSLVFLGLLVWAVARICSSVETRLNPASPPHRLFWTIFVCVAAVTFYPVVKSVNLGQAQTWISAEFALVLLFWYTGRPRAAGAVTALMCAIKPHYALLVLWGVIRKQWAFVKSATWVGLSILALSVAVFGLSAHVEYLRVLSYVSRRGEAFWPNQSVNGVLNRWFETGSILQFDASGYPAYHPVVHIGTIVSMVVLLVLGLFGPIRHRKGDSIDLSVMMVAVTVASPIAWDHHYGILLPIFGLALANATGPGWLGRPMAVLFGIAWILTAGYYPMVLGYAHNRVLALALSYSLVGVICALIVLHSKSLASERSAPGQLPAGAR